MIKSVTSAPSIVVNGDLGSGKTTVTLELALRLGVRRVSVGDLYREMAKQRGMSALQLNLHAELDDAVDGYVDRLQRDIAGTNEQLVMDSRLAWHFFRSAFKVHLLVQPIEAARRALQRPSTDVEHYSSLEEAVIRLRDRSESERQRFLVRYGVDKTSLRNYSLVCDTTRASPSVIIDAILGYYFDFLSGSLSIGSMPVLLIDPARIYPSEDIRILRGSWDADCKLEQHREDVAQRPISVAYTGSQFCVVRGHRRLSRALRLRETLIPARLVAEGKELVVADISATQYFRSQVKLSTVYDWEEAHGSTLGLPDHVVGELGRKRSYMIRSTGLVGETVGRAVIEQGPSSHIRL